MKATIVEAIKEVMQIKGEPMTVAEVHDQIVANKLYHFKAANPVNIVNSQVRRHCKGIPEQKSYSKIKHFKLVGTNKYFLLDEPEIASIRKEEVYKEYHLPKLDAHRSISSDDISRGDTNFQAKVMKEWFLLNYEPAIKDSRGGYIYLLDGPYEVKDVLENEFLGVLQVSIIEKVAKDIEQDSGFNEWSKIPKDDDIEEYFIEDINRDFYRSFENTIRTVKKLADHSADMIDEIQQPLNRMLYASIITAMESYLSDTFIDAIRSNELSRRKLIEQAPELRERSLKLGEIYRRLDAIPKEVDEYLNSIVYHRLDKVKELYFCTLGVEFPKDLSNIFRAIITRHDIVHRDGKDKDGNIVTISSKDIRLLLKNVVIFVKKVDEQLKKK
jgi:hypothetical protein